MFLFSAYTCVYKEGIINSDITNDTLLKMIC